MTGLAWMLNCLIMFYIHALHNETYLGDLRYIEFLSGRMTVLHTLVTTKIIHAPRPVLMVIARP